jgi:hypothetical protein
VAVQFVACYFLLLHIKDLPRLEFGDELVVKIQTSYIELRSRSSIYLQSCCMKILVHLAVLFHVHWACISFHRIMMHGS